MHSEKENQEISVLGRLVSLEALVFLVAVVSLIYGLVVSSVLHVLIGAAIVAAAALLVRKGRRMLRK